MFPLQDLPSLYFLWIGVGRNITVQQDALNYSELLLVDSVCSVLKHSAHNKYGFPPKMRQVKVQVFRHYDSVQSYICWQNMRS